jgi:RNA polymerase sigma factor (sigma-70 family)
MAIQDVNDDAYLLQRVAQKDSAALSALYDRYARVIYAVAYRILGSVDEAEEIVLDVFSQVWRSSAQYNVTRGRVDSWLFLLTRSRALDRLRKLKRSARTIAASESAVLTQPHQVPDPSEQLLICERRDRVQAALNQIPVEQQQVLELAYYEGLSHTEIAAKTGLALGTIKTRIRLGLNKLRTALEASDPEQVG